MAYRPTKPVLDDTFASGGIQSWEDRVAAIDLDISGTIDVLRDSAPPGRDVSVAITKLQEAQMWLAKSLCVDDDTSTHDEKQVKRA